MENINMNNDKSKKQNKQKKITVYDIAKNRYARFIVEIEKNDMKNNYTRYLIEYNLLKQIEEYAHQYGTEDEANAAAEQITRIKEILKEQFGIIKK